MSSLAILIPVSLGMGLIGLCAFFWAIRNKQFDDLEGSAWRVIPSRQEPTPEKEGTRYDNLAPDPEDSDT